MKSNNKSKIHFIVWMLSLMVIIPFSAYGVDGQIKIGQTDSTTFPIVIDQPGSYVLTSNIIPTVNVSGIVITTDNITLELNGHAIIGPGKGTGGFVYGIDGRGRKNVSIINGTVRDFPGDGIALHGAGWDHVPTNGSNNLVKDIKAYNNGGGGIVVTNAVVTNSSANSNGFGGITAESSIITNCTTNDNGTNDIGVGIAAIMSTVTNCTANFNRLDGIRAANSTITNCTTNSNRGNGILAFMHEFGTSSTTIINCTANSNSGAGIFAHHNCRIEGNNLRNNGFGLFLQGLHNYAIKNTASDNNSGNFHADNIDENYMPTTGDNANVGW